MTEERERGSAFQPSDPSGVRMGLSVYAREGTHLGEVKAIADGAFQVDRRMQPDLWLDLSAVDDVRDEKVILVPFMHELEGFKRVAP